MDSRPTIDDIRNRLLMELKQQNPVYLYVDPQLGEEISPLWIGEVAQAVATLYVGYQLGNQIEDVGRALARTIDAIGDIARSIAKVIDKLGEIIDAIARALEAIHRHIDAAFMQLHFSNMKAASLTIQDVIARLQVLPHDPHDPRVKDYLHRLQNHLDNLFYAIVGYLNQEQGKPSPAALIGCAPSMALWAQTYTIIERYKAVQDRLAPWKTASQSEMRQFVDTFFTDYIQQRVIVQEELRTTYLVPRAGETFEFANGRFLLSATPYRREYPDDPRYYGLFSRDSFNPFGFYGTYVKSGLLLGWQAVVPMNLGNFPDPDHARAALEWHGVCQQEIRKRQLFLTDTERFNEYKARALDAMKEQEDW